MYELYEAEATYSKCFEILQHLLKETVHLDQLGPNELFSNDRQHGGLL